MKSQPKSHFRHAVAFLYKHFKRLKWFALLTLLPQTAAVVFIVLIPTQYKALVDAVAQGQTEGLVIIIGIIALFNLAENISSRISEYYGNYFFAKGVSAVGLEAFAYLQKHSYRFFINNFAGSLVRKVNKLINMFDVVFAQLFWYFYPVVLGFIGVIVVFYTIAPIISIVLIVWSIGFTYISYRLNTWRLRYSIRQQEEDSKISAILSDAISNNFNVKVFANHKHEETLLSKQQHRWSEAFIRNFNIGIVTASIQSILMLVLEFALLYIMIGMWEQGHVTAGDFVMLQALLTQFLMRLWEIGRTIRKGFEAYSSGIEMIEIMNTQHEVKDIPHATTLRVTEGAIDIRDLTFSYNEHVHVFKDFGLSIPAQRKVALVSRSGEGKSTLIRLIMRLYNVPERSIFIDGQDIMHVTQDSVRNNISFVPQDPVLFHRTLKDNIAYGKSNATLDEVIEASKKAHCHEFISNLKDGYNTYVGERGVKLSGGERQRVAIARAILEDAPIIILDEATSALDSESEKFIQDALHKLMKNKTAIVIAHRLSTIMAMDEIVVIEKGVITERGTHQELSTRTHGHYAKLWNIQAGAFNE